MKQISQEFFNESVQTNMELLELSLEEAIEETVKTFQIEGVDLSNIVKDMLKFTEGHPSEELIKQLRSAQPGDQNLVHVMESLKNICAEGLAHRKLLVDHGILSALMPIISQCIAVSEMPSAILALDLFGDVINAQAQVLNTESGNEQFTTILNIMEDHLKRFNQISSDAKQLDLLSSLYVVMRLSCIENEAKRRQISDSSVIPDTLSLLSRLTLARDMPEFRSVCTLLRACCALLRGMTLDDDMNVEFGLGTMNARNIASSNSSIDIFVKLANATLALDTSEPMVDIFLTLSAILTREEFCCQFADVGGMDLVFNTLQAHLDSAALASACLSLLCALCGSDACKRAAGNWTSSDAVPSDRATSGPQLVLGALERHIKNPVVAKHAAYAVAAITLRQPDLAERFVSAGAPEFLAKALQLHISNSGTVRAVCMAIRNCVSRSPNLQTAFVGSSCLAYGTKSSLSQDSGSADRDPYGLESLLNSAMKLRDCADEAKAALRDLGCRVELKELWRGGLNEGKKPTRDNGHPVVLNAQSEH